MLDKYESNLAALEDISESKGDAATRAAGVLTKFQEGCTYVLLCLAANIIGQLDTYISSLKSKNNTMSARM